MTALRAHLRRGLARSLGDRNDVDDADLEDFAQDATLRVIDRIDSFRGQSHVTTWALAVAIRVAYTALRRRRWGDRSLDERDERAPQHVAAVEAPDPAARTDLLDALRTAIDRDLTPRQRTAVLAELAGMPTAVLAEQLGTNANALYKLHHDARRRLRTALEQAGFSETEVRNALQDASRS